MRGIDESASDAGLLEKFHYKQELRRTIRLFGVFAVAFSAISLTTGIFQNFGFVISTVGPLGIWTFPVVGFGSFVIALLFSEISTIVPVTGQCYVWVTKLCNPGVGWIVGWLNFCYSLVILPSVDTSLGPVVATLFGVPATPAFRTAVAVGALSIQLLLNIFSVKVASMINNAAVVTESGGILILTVLLTVCAIRNGNSPSNMAAVNPAVAGHSLLLPVLMSFLMGFYTLVAFESAANMSDETKSAAKNVPKAMLMAIGFSTLFGTLFLMASTWAIRDLPAVIKSDAPMPFIIESNLGPVVGKMFLIIVCISIFACGQVFLTYSSRTIFAMSRDEAFFASRIFRKVDKRTATPIPACIFVWFIGVIFLVFTTPSALAVASAAMPSLYYIITVISYLAVRRQMTFPEGHFKLGRLGIPVIVFSILWLIFGLSILSIPKEFHAGILVNIGLTLIGLILYLAYFRKRVYANRADLYISGEKEEIAG